MSVFDHFVELALKGQVKLYLNSFQGNKYSKTTLYKYFKLFYFKQLKKKQFNYKEMIS